jgi:hypothetical protein
MDQIDPTVYSEKQKNYLLQFFAHNFDKLDSFYTWYF